MAQMVVYGGIDVSKQWLDVALWPKREQLRVSRTPAGLARLADWLGEHAVMRVGLEATAGYEIEVIDALEASGFEVATSTSAEFGAVIKAALDRYRSIAADARLEPQ